MSLSQSQAGEGQERTNVSADSSQTELHRELGHWNSGRSQKQANIVQRLAKLFVNLSLLLADA